MSGGHVCSDGSYRWSARLEELGGVEKLPPPSGLFFFATSSDQFIASNDKLMSILNAKCWVCAWLLEYEYFLAVNNIQGVKKEMSATLREKLAASAA